MWYLVSGRLRYGVRGNISGCCVEVGWRHTGLRLVDSRLGMVRARREEGLFGGRGGGRSTGLSSGLRVVVERMSVPLHTLHVAG